jgi:hypothetical protein
VGTSPTDANVISGNQLEGVVLLDSNNNVIQFNYIGTNANRAALGNGGAGVEIDNGFSNSVYSNRIACNNGEGVRVDGATSCPLRSNSIFANDSLGIRLVNFGNLFLSAPHLDFAGGFGGFLVVSGSLNSWLLSTFTLEFFINSVCDPSGFGQGERFAGSSSVSTDVWGQASFTTVLANVPPGGFVTATATELVSENTSGFSNCVAVSGFAPPGWGGPGPGGVEQAVLGEAELLASPGGIGRAGPVGVALAANAPAAPANVPARAPELRGDRAGRTVSEDEVGAVPLAASRQRLLTDALFATGSDDRSLFEGLAGLPAEPLG